MLVARLLGCYRSWHMEGGNTENATVSVGACMFVLRTPPVISDVSLNTTVNICSGYVPRESVVPYGLWRGRNWALVCLFVRWLHEDIEVTVSTDSMKWDTPPPVLNHIIWAECSGNVTAMKPCVVAWRSPVLLLAQRRNILIEDFADLISRSKPVVCNFCCSRNLRCNLPSTVYPPKLLMYNSSYTSL
jgi:hypothetical protein